MVIGQSCAAVRAGYRNAGDYPFLNLQVSLPSDPQYRPVQNLVLARALGAAPLSDIHWTAASRSKEELAHVLHEHQIPSDAWLIGIDVHSFFSPFGGEWLEALVESLRMETDATVYLYLGDTTDPESVSWIRHQAVPTLAGLTATRIAALLERTGVVVSGVSPFFELARLFARPSVGVFDSEQAAFYGKPTGIHKIVTYRGTPDNDTLSSTLSAAAGLLAAHKASLPRTPSRK
jgi:hypothetical protein